MVRVYGSPNAHKPPTATKIAQGRLRWFGHLLRSPLNHPAHAIYTFNPRGAGWSRPRGAPRTQWSDVLGKGQNGWGQHWRRLPTSPSTVLAGGQPLFLVPSLRSRGKSERASERERERERERESE